MDLDSSSSSLSLPVTIPPVMPLTGITPVDSPVTPLLSGGEQSPAGIPPVSQATSSKRGSTTPTSYNDTPKAKKSTGSSKGVKTEPVGVALTRTSHRQIKRPKTDEELIDFESSSRSSVSKKTKSSTRVFSGVSV